MNRGAFLMRGLDKVRADFSLTALVYNLRRFAPSAQHPRRRGDDGGGPGVKSTQDYVSSGPKWPV
jgi:hypothetical protein